MGYEYHLIELMKERGIRQAELSRRSGVSQSSINRYVLGESDIPASKLVKIAEALGTSVDELLQTNQPTLEEEQLILDYRKLDKDNKELVRSIIKSLSK